MKVIEASFVKSASRPSDIPESLLPQIVVAGRSNVGKSSLINCLFGRRKLARVSGTPGATRLINFFLIEEKFLLADLPGYGYARRSKSERRMWKRLVEGYLDTVTTLQGMFLLIDLRRGPEEEEFQLLELFASRGLGGLCILTKSDKMPKHKRRLRYLEISRGLHEEFGVQSMLFSSKTGEGREALWHRTQKWIPSSDDKADLDSL